MSTMTKEDLFKALLLAVVAFQQEYDKNHKEEQANLDEMDEDERDEAEEEYPEELEGENFVERFCDWLTSNGIEPYQTATVSGDASKKIDHILGRG